MALFTGLFAGAQEMPQVQSLPVDSLVRQGVLPNGLTYFIRHNETPKGQADFYIAQKVGSILENDSQRGLAHFLEHMCFNGTQNFPGNKLITWLESVGVKFGQNPQRLHQHRRDGVQHLERTHRTRKRAGFLPAHPSRLGRRPSARRQ